MQKVLMLGLKITKCPLQYKQLGNVSGTYQGQKEFTESVNLRGFPRILTPLNFFSCYNTQVMTIQFAFVWIRNLFKLTYKWSINMKEVQLYELARAWYNFLVSNWQFLKDINCWGWSKKDPIYSLKIWNHYNISAEQLLV